MKVVGICGCVDEECSMVLAFRREERLQQVVTVSGNLFEQFTVGIITDTGESSSVTQFCRLTYKCFQAISPSCRRVSQPVRTSMT